MQQLPDTIQELLDSATPQDTRLYDYTATWTVRRANRHKTMTFKKVRRETH